MGRKIDPNLTIRQREVFVFVEGFISQHGFPPSIREIAESFHMAPSSAFEHLKAIARKNFIRVFPHKRRCLEILKRGIPADGREMA